MDIVQQYVETTNGSQEEAYTFLRNNRRAVSKDLFKEMALNYRTYYHKDQHDRIYREYVNYICTKVKTHNSDLAIGYNIVCYVPISEERKEIIIDYLALRTGYNDIKSKIIQKSLVLNLIEKNILIKKRDEIPISRSV